MGRIRSFLLVLIMCSSIVFGGCTAMFTKEDRPTIPVVVSTLAPPAPSNNLGSITAVDGIGCGLLGLLGNRENAVYILKQKAVQHGANYVQILKTKEPYSDGQCRHNEFVLEGNAFKTVPLEEQAIGAIAIRNPGFENDVLARDGVAEAWHYNLKDWSGNKGGVFSVTATPSTFLAGKAPEGHNVAFLAFSGSNIEQTLDFRLVPNRTYQLQVLVGRRTEAAFGEGDYQVELQAGGRTIAEERGKLPPAGEFKVVKVSYTAKRQDSQKGQPLKIVLKNINTRQINYDSVRLYNWVVGSNFVIPDIPQSKAVFQEESIEVLSSDFSHINTSHVISEYHGQPTPRTVIANSERSGVRQLQIQNNKWIFSSGFGRGPLLGTHPINSSKPSIFDIKVVGNTMKYAVHPHSNGDSLIEFWVKETLIHSETISEKKWNEGIISLPQNTQTVTLKHHATGWSFEYLYWSFLGSEAKRPSSISVTINKKNEAGSNNKVLSSGKENNLSGTWREIIFGRDMGVARIKQNGRKLKFWNFEKPPKFSRGRFRKSGVIHAKGWNLTAKLKDKGDRIVWSNGVVWIRE